MMLRWSAVAHATRCYRDATCYSSAQLPCWKNKRIVPQLPFQIGTEKDRGEQTVTVIRNKAGQFVARWGGGPGRPPGARSKLSEIAIAAIRDDFALHGKATIEKVRREKPHVYLDYVVRLLPKQLHVERTSPLGELSDAELEELEAFLASSRAKLVRKLNGATLELKPSEKQRGS
jgi:hypothetical protein